ncbi:MAG: response regulator, partial [Lentisphaeria bacterium]|nr:response regulator [Lentisphaeria bacterium]
GADVAPGERQEYLNSINCAGNALLDLVNGVLDLSRLEADQVKLDYQPVDLKRLIRDIVGVFRLRAVEKNLYLQVDDSGLPPVLYLDDLRIRQILLNLTGNALKFTHSGGVNVTAMFRFAEEAGVGTLIFDITDTGIGIRPEKIAQIFDPFVQDSGTRGTRVYEGAGLGLAISKRLVEKMGGTISVASIPGKGSTFTVKLENVKYSFPASGEAAKAGAAQSSPAVPASQCIRALLVDDVPMNLKVLQAMLKKLDVNCVLAESAEKALEILQQGWQFDIILTDLWMPGLSGSAFADLLKRNEQTAGIPVVAVTADTQITSEDAQKFRQVLTKPITRQALIDAFRANGLNI